MFLSRMLAITRGHRGLLAIAIAGSVLYTALSVVPALIIRQILVTVGHPGASTGTLVLLGLAMVATTALMAVARYLEGGFGHLAAFRVLHDLRMRCYDQLQRLSMGFHTRQQSGTMAAKVIGDVETIEFFTAHAGIQLISAALVPFLIGILMLIVNWRLALVALAVAEEPAHRFVGPAERDLDVLVPHQQAPAADRVAFGLEPHRREVPVRVLVRHPLLALDRLESVELHHAARRLQVVED